MAVKTKKTFPNAVGANGQSSTVFTPVEVQLNNQDDLDVYVTLSGGTRVLQNRNALTNETAQSSHPQVNDTTGLYFPAVTAGTTLYNYSLSTDNNTITFNSALPNGAVVSIERRTRDADSSYTTFASGSTIRATDLNNSSTESNFTAQEARNKAFELEGKIFGGEATSTSFISSDEIVDGTIVNADINDNAEIAVSKLANGSARQILQTAANGTDVEFTSNVDIPGTLDVTGNADIDSNLNVDGTFTVAGAADLNGNLDVDGDTNLDNTTIDGYIDVNGIATVDNVQINGNEVRATSGNLNLDSANGTVDVNDNLNVTGNLTTNGTFNNLTTTEIAILDGATLSTAELNTLDGITATTTELNHVDGVTSNVQTQLDAKQPLDAELTELATMSSTTASSLADLTQAEVQILDGATVSTAELNKLDGVTTTTTELNKLDGATVTTAELNKLDGYTGTTADLNEVVSGKSVVETISNTATDAQIPTAQAVNERITTVVSDVGGFVPIANETSFPTDNPDLDNAAGTIVSIKALNSPFTTGVGVTTHTFTNGAGSGNNVTITGLTQSTTYPAGRGMLLETTPTSGNGSANPPRAYAFHRLTLDETGVAAAQAAIDDWDERYYGPLGSEPNTRPGGGARVQGDLYFSTVDNQMKVWNNAASQWDDVASSASSNIITLSPAFNGSETEFTCSTVPVDAQSLLLSINGVIQKPNSGTSTPSEGYVKLANGKIKLASPPATGAPYFAVSLGNTVSIGTPSPDTVGATELKNGEIANVHVSSSAAIAGTKISPNFGSADVVTTGNLDLSDSTGAGNNRIRLGNSDDFSLFHDGSDNKIIAANGGLLVQSNSYSLRNENGSATYLTINSSGDVGIGTTAPRTELDLSQGQLSFSHRTDYSIRFYNGQGNNWSSINNPRAADGTNASELEFRTASGVAMHMATDGKIGIGSTSPGFKLDVAHNTADTFRVSNTNETGHGSHDAKIVAGGSYYQNPTIVGREIKFRTFNTAATEGERIRIDKDGNLGIGTSAPSEILHVNSGTDNICGLFESTDNEAQVRIKDSGSYTGIIAVTNGAFAFENTGNGSLVKITNDGKVGIGTTSLGTANLAVKGTATAWGGAGNATHTVGAKLVLEDDQGRKVSMWAPKAADAAVGTISNHHFAIVTGNATHTFFNQSTGNVQISDGNLTVASGHGIDFSATGDASGAASELFDDYEEGTFTPVLDQGITGVSYNIQAGHYTKIGNQVFAYVYLLATATGNNNSGLRVGGLPFDNNNSAYNEGGGYITYINATFGTSGANMHAMPWVPQNSDKVFFHTPEDGNNLQGSETNFANKYLIFHVRYHT